MVFVPFAARNDLRELISNVAGPLPAEDIEYMKVAGTWPHHEPVLSLHAHGAWTDRPLYTDVLPLSAARSGDMYFYR